MYTSLLISLSSALMALLVFERLLQLLAPGARRFSRWVYTGLLLAIAPAFLRVAWSSRFEMSGILIVFTALLFGLRGHERGRPADLLRAVFLAALCFHMDQPRFVLLVPLLLVLLADICLRRAWLQLASGMVLGLGTVWLLDYLRVGIWPGTGVDLLRQWSLGNYAQTIFPDGNGIREHLLPNAAYLLYPVAHPMFCAMLPGLFLLSKKTDLALSSKKILLASILAFLVLIGGFPKQDTLLLLPAYALLLLLLFPAWDRFYCYGFIFFKRLTVGILLLALLLQVFFGLQVLAYG